MAIRLLVDVSGRGVTGVSLWRPVRPGVSTGSLGPRELDVVLSLHTSPVTRGSMSLYPESFSPRVVLQCLRSSVRSPSQGSSGSWVLSTGENVTSPWGGGPSDRTYSGRLLLAPLLQTVHRILPPPHRHTFSLEGRVWLMVSETTPHTSTNFVFSDWSRVSTR